MAIKEQSKISYHNAEIPPRYEELIARATPLMRDVVFRWSYNRTPHLLVENNNGVIVSLCYFKRHNSWRAFYPYGASTQQHFDCLSIDEILVAVEKLGGKQ